MQEVRKIYQIYIEYFFLLNFVFFYGTWNVSVAFLNCSVTQKKLLLASFLGALGICVCLCLPLVLWYRLLIGAGGTFFVGISVLFPKRKGYLRYIAVFFLTAVLLGGSIALVQKACQRSEFSILQMIVTTLVLSFAIKILLQRYFCPKHALIYPITLIWEGAEYQMKALLDTGNSLVEPISQKAVCVVGEDVLKKSVVKEGERNAFHPRIFRVIPYHSVGRENGMLSGYEMDRLIIHTDERKIIIEKPMIGISRVPIGSPGSYRMILHPELLREGEI